VKTEHGSGVERVAEKAVKLGGISEKHPPGAKAHIHLMILIGTTKQAAEKLIKIQEVRESHSSGVKTPTHFNDLIGTDKSVPFQSGGIGRVFPQPVKSCPFKKR
jgi:hypothetical protein